MIVMLTKTRFSALHGARSGANNAIAVLTR